MSKIELGVPTHKIINTCLEWNIKLGITYKINNINITYYFQRSENEKRFIYKDNNRKRRIYTKLQNIECVGYTNTKLGDYKNIFQKIFKWDIFVNEYLKIYNNVFALPFRYKNGKVDNRNISELIKKIQFNTQSNNTQSNNTQSNNNSNDNPIISYKDQLVKKETPTQNINLLNWEEMVNNIDKGTSWADIEENGY